MLIWTCFPGGMWNCREREDLAGRCQTSNAPAPVQQQPLETENRGVADQLGLSFTSGAGKPTWSTPARDPGAGSAQRSDRHGGRPAVHRRQCGNRLGLYTVPVGHVGGRPSLLNDLVQRLSRFVGDGAPGMTLWVVKLWTSLLRGDGSRTTESVIEATPRACRGPQPVIVLPCDQRRLAWAVRASDWTASGGGGASGRAATGQGQPMALYQRAMETTATRGAGSAARSDLAERRRYHNASNTLVQLLDWGVLPIVNENDALSPRSRFGDNDTLPAGRRCGPGGSTDLRPMWIGCGRLIHERLRMRRFRCPRGQSAQPWKQALETGSLGNWRHDHQAAAAHCHGQRHRPPRRWTHPGTTDGLLSGDGAAPCFIPAANLWATLQRTAHVLQPEEHSSSIRVPAAPLEHQGASFRAGLQG